MNKTFYLDPDEDVIATIDRIRSTDAADITLAVPKDSILFGSLVNLRLLKKAAADLGKRCVVDTTDPRGRKLAQEAGLLAAGLMPEKPAIPVAPAPPSVAETPSPTPSRPEPLSATAPPFPSPKPTRTAPKIPFLRFSPKTLLAAAGALLVVGAFLFVVLGASAVVRITPKTEAKATSLNFTVDGKAKQTDREKNIIPGQAVTASKEKSDSFTATGKKTVGTKATGTAKLTNTCASASVALPKGTKLFGNDTGKNFLTTADITVPKKSGGIGGSASVAIEAEQIGASYNLAAGAESTFRVAASVDPGSCVSGENSTATTGGSSKEVTAVAQADVDNAQKALEPAATGEANKDLNERSSGKLVEGSIKKDVTITPTPAVGEEVGADGKFTAKVTVTVTGLSFNEDVVYELLRLALTKTLAPNTQIYKDPADLTYKTTTPLKDTVAGFSAEGSFAVGPHYDTEKIKKDLAGMNDKDAKGYLDALPQIESSEIEHRPGWIRSMPRFKQRITVEVVAASSSGASSE